MKWEQEQKIIALSAALLFGVTSAFIVLKSARDALILTDYSIKVLPYFMAVSTVVSALAATVLLRLHKRFRLQGVVDLSFKAFAVGTFLLWGGIKIGWPLSTPLLYLWTGIYATIAPVQAWLIIGNHLLIRQARRTLGWIGAGAILGASAGGFFSHFIADITSVPALLPAAAVLILLSLFAKQALSVFGTRLEPQHENVEQEQPRRALIILTLVLVSSSIIVATFADFQFKVVAQRNLKDAHSLAEFFGSFYAYTGMATLIFQLVVTPFLMSKLPVSTTLSLLPAGLAAGNALLLWKGNLSAAIVLKGSEQLFKHSIDRSSLEVLYLAVPESAKGKFKSLVDVFGVRGSETLAAALLIVLISISGLPLTTLAIISLVMSAACFVSAFLLHREYPKALKKAIQHRDLNVSIVKAEFFTTDFYNLIPELMKNANKETVLDLLQMLVNAKNRKLQSYLEPLLNHEDPEIRLKALQLLFTQEEDFTKSVEKMTNDSDRRVRVEAIHYMCFRGTSNPLDRLTHLMLDPDPAIQAAAYACSLNEPEESAQKLAYDRLENLLSTSNDNSDLEVRIEVAHILEYIAQSPASEALIRKLLADPVAAVRKATLKSISRSTPPSMLQILISMLNDLEVRNELRIAIASYGDRAAPLLTTLLQDRSTPLEVSKFIIKVMADAAAAQSIQTLLSTALGPSLPLRFAAIKALNRVQRHRPLTEFRLQLASLLEQELTGYEIELQRRQFFAPKPNGLMERTLRQRQRWSRERIFRTLGLLYDSKAIYNAYLSISGGDKRKADSAFEFLDNILAPEHRHRVLKLFETMRVRRPLSYQPSARKSVLLGFLGARDELPASSGLIDLEDSEWGDWKEEISGLLRAFPGMLLVQETFEWRNLLVDANPKLQRKLPTIQKIERLGRIKIFSHLGPQELLLLANESEEVEFTAGSTIYKEGDKGTLIYSLVSGRVQMLREGELVFEVDSGQSFGELSALGEQPHFFTAVAGEDSFCLAIDHESLWGILEDYPETFRGLLKAIAVRFRDLI